MEHKSNASTGVLVATTSTDDAVAERRSGFGLAVSVVVAAAFYRSLSMWTANAWDLSSPLKVLLIGGVIAFVGVALLLLLGSFGLRLVPAALCVAGLVLTLMNWQTLEESTRPLIIALILIFGWLGQLSRANMWGWLAVVFVSAFGLAPIIQLVGAHVQDSEPYPLVERRTPEPATASGVIEDVVVVVADTYPNLDIAESWFGHDTGPLTEDLEMLGFTVEPGAWSQHTFTSLSVPSILELQSVIEGGPTGPWGNRSSLYRVARGENFVARTLQSAGFRYTHIESGWDGTGCGPRVDHCVQAPLLDEQAWELLLPTIAMSWVKDGYFTVPGTFNTAEALERELGALVSNGSHDFVFAHFLLPHDPVVVGETCEAVAPTAPREVDVDTLRAAFSDQMTCVDHLLVTALKSVDADTAVLVTGDHGPSTSRQVGLTPNQWSDADIAERFSVLLAYKLPDECLRSERADPIAAMSAILSCAVESDYVSPTPEYLIGADDPGLVEAERMTRIQALVASGSLPPDSG